MDKVSIAKRQFRIEEWRKRITECQASGIAVTHWCKLSIPASVSHLSGHRKPLLYIPTA